MIQVKIKAVKPSDKRPTEEFTPKVFEVIFSSSQSGEILIRLKDNDAIEEKPKVSRFTSTRASVFMDAETGKCHIYSFGVGREDMFNKEKMVEHNIKLVNVEELFNSNDIKNKDRAFTMLRTLLKEIQIGNYVDYFTEGQTFRQKKLQNHVEKINQLFDESHQRWISNNTKK
jgi:hypothetical protein